ncbi:MAG: hypothetical protein JWP57_4364, partial [Spirosoma sp.]|nr:hypothetical protein [Spirosoma sp.]
DSERVQGLVEIGALDPKNPAATGDPNAAVPNPPRQNKAPWATA